MANTLNISIERYGLWFHPKEILFLNEEYNFYIKVLNGEVEPKTVQQKIFAKVFNDKIKPLKEPITHHSRTYQELSKNQKTIIRQ